MIFACKNTFVDENIIFYFFKNITTFDLNYVIKEMYLFQKSFKHFACSHSFMSIFLKFVEQMII
jgi:hypothetical protein